MSYYDTHENDSVARYNEMQERLTKTTDETGLKVLSAQVDIQLKLEDFLIKFREADHAKIEVWVPIFLPPAVSILVAILAIVVHRNW